MDNKTDWRLTYHAGAERSRRESRERKGGTQVFRKQKENRNTRFCTQKRKHAQLISESTALRPFVDEHALARARRMWA